MFHRGWFWMHATDARLAEHVVGVIRDYGVARVGELDRAALDQLSERGRWAGLVAELTAGTLEQLVRVRQLVPTLPVLAVLRATQVGSLNALTAHGIEAVVAPVDARSITGFVQRAFAASFFPDDRVARLVAELAVRCKLTPREVQVLSFCLGNEPRTRVRRRLGISENTLKTQIKGLLRKCNERSVDALAKNVLRAALLQDRQALLVTPVAPWLPLANAG